MSETRTILCNITVENWPLHFSDRSNCLGCFRRTTGTPENRIKYRETSSRVAIFPKPCWNLLSPWSPHSLRLCKLSTVTDLFPPIFTSNMLLNLVNHKTQYVELDPLSRSCRGFSSECPVVGRSCACCWEFRTNATRRSAGLHHYIQVMG